MFPTFSSTRASPSGPGTESLQGNHTEVWPEGQSAKHGFSHLFWQQQIKRNKQKKRLKEKLRTPLTDSLIGRLKHDVQSSPTVVNLVDPHSLKAEVLSLIRHWSGRIWTWSWNELNIYPSSIQAARQTSPSVSKITKVWSEEYDSVLQDCFGATNWVVFKTAQTP